MFWELFVTLTLLCAWIYGIALCYLHSNRVMFMAFSKWKGGPVCWSCWLSMAHDPINKGPICSVDQFFVPQVSITCPCYRSCLDNRNLFSYKFRKWRKRSKSREWLLNVYDKRWPLVKSEMHPLEWHPQFTSLSRHKGSLSWLNFLKWVQRDFSEDATWVFPRVTGSNTFIVLIVVETDEDSLI